MPATAVHGDKSHLGYIDLNKNELRNARVQNLATPPSSPVTGQLYYDSDDNVLFYWNGTTWQSAAGGSGAIPASTVDAKGDLIVGTANDTVARLARGAVGTVPVADDAPAGGITWRTLTEADIQVGATARLLGRVTAGAGAAEEIPLATDLEFSGGSLRVAAFTGGDVTKNAGGVTLSIGANKVLYSMMQDVTAAARFIGRASGAGAGDPTELDAAAAKVILDYQATEVDFTPAQSIAATNVQAAIEELKTDMDAAMTAATEGKAWKDPVRVASTANLTLSGTQTIDGVAVVAGDRVLAKDQTTTAERGIYVVAAGAWARSADMNTADEADNATVLIEEGATNGGDVYTQTNDIVTIGVTGQVWTKVSEGNTVYTAGANGGLQLAGTAFSLASTVAGSGLTLTSGVLDVATGTGLEISSDAVRIAAAAAGNGLTGGAGSALAVGAGNGIAVTADAVAVDPAVVVRKASGSLSGTPGNSAVLNHALNTRDVRVTLRNNASPYDEVEVYNEATDLNNVTIYAAAGANLPASYRWLVVG